MPDLIYILGVASGVIIALAIETVVLAGALMILIFKGRKRRCRKKH